MRRLTVSAILLAVASIGVVAATAAPEANGRRVTTTRPAKWSDRWGQFTRNLTGGNNEKAESTPAKKGSNMSADRKFGVPQARAQKSEPETASRPTAQPQTAASATVAKQAPPRANTNSQAPNFSSSFSPKPEVATTTSSRRTAQPGYRASTPMSSIASSPTQAPARSYEPTPSYEAEEAEVETTPIESTPIASAPQRSHAPETGTSAARSIRERLSAVRDANAAATMPSVLKPSIVAERPAPTNPFPGARAETFATDAADDEPRPAETRPTYVPYVARAEERKTDTTVDLSSSEPKARSATPNESVLFNRQSPALSVETTGPRTVVIGKEAAFTVTIQNTGEVSAQDVVVSVKAPAWADVVNARTTSGVTKPLSEASEPLEWKLPRLEAHSKEQLVLRLIPRESKPFDLGVEWTSSPVGSQALVEVQEPKLLLALAGPEEVIYGQMKIFKLTLSNPGTGDAENVVIELLPIGNDPKGAAKHEIGLIAAGENKVVEVELTAVETGAITFRAEATADGGLKSQVSQDVLVRRAGLELAVQGPKSRYAGTSATYAVRLTNPGNADAQRVQVAAKLPAGAKYLSNVGGGQYDPLQNQVIWKLPALGPGDVSDLEVKCLLTSGGANRLEVVSTAAENLSDSTPFTTAVEALADLKLEVIDPQGPIAINEEMTYEIHVHNRGSKSAEQVEIVALVSDGMEPVSVQGGNFEVLNREVVFKPVATLLPGGEIVYKVKAKATVPGNHAFRAEVMCPAMGTQLASEETTYFYGDDSSADEESEPAATASPRTARSKAPGQLSPAPLGATLSPLEANE